MVNSKFYGNLINSPTNTRAGGNQVNPDYKHTFVFENDFPALNSFQPSYSPHAIVDQGNKYRQDFSINESSQG